MGLYTPEAVTLWVIQAESSEILDSLFEFTYGDDGETKSSPFAQAYRLDWYDSDFSVLESGASVSELLKQMSETCRTLDEQASSCLPQGGWNGIYLIYGQAGEEWQASDSRPMMPHSVVEVEEVKFKLVDTFHVLIRPN